MKSIKEEKNLDNKKILLRLDLNVPLLGDKITDTTRIDKILPTLNFLISQNAKIIIISHVGRPKGKVVNELSLRPICEDLEKKLNQNIKLISKNVKEIISKDLFNNDNERIVILENIRFYSEEEKQTRVNIRSKAVGRNAVSRKRNVSQSNNERCEESDISKKSKRQTLNNRGRDEKKNISNTSPEGLQRRNFEQELQQQELGLSSYNDDETKQTWWQIESNICGVPNGISYELDKDRANRIKTLGNAIVPQIAREFGLAIKKVLSDEDII